MQNRLDELKLAEGADAKKAEVKVEQVKIDIEAHEKTDMDDALTAFASITAGIAKIEKNVEAINALKQRSKQEVKEQAQRKIMEDLDRTMVAAKRDVRFVKGELDKVSSENAKYLAEHQGSTSAQIRKNLLNTHARHFQEAIVEYQQAGDSFKEALKERIARQARIVKEDITEEQIEDLMSNPNPAQIFQSAVIQLDDRMIDAVHDIEDRHKGMMAIEQGVKEIQELFNDLQCLVDLQQETLDVIERNVMDTSKYTKDGEKNMIAAENHAKNARRKQCWMLLIVVVIVFIIIMVVFKV